MSLSAKSLRRDAGSTDFRSEILERVDMFKTSNVQEARDRSALDFDLVQPLHHTAHMPTIYREGNWKIMMYFDDHGMPHFHILTPNAEAKVAIDTLEVIAGDIGRKTLAAARTWATENRELLHRCWNEFSEAE